MPLSTKPYNLVVGTGHGAAGKVTVGLASHWSCITDFSGLSAYRLTAMSGVPTLFVGYGTLTVTFRVLSYHVMSCAAILEVYLQDFSH